MLPANRKLRIGATLVALSYMFALLGRTHSLLGRMVHGSGAHASGHGGEDSLALPLVAASLAALGVLIAWIPLRRGERWAFWAAGLPVIVLGTAKIASDPGCTTRFFQKHGCHQFMISLVTALTGLVMCANALFARKTTP